MKSLYKNKTIIAILLFFITGFVLLSQNLERRPYLGITLLNLNDSLRKLTNYYTGDGVYVGTIHKNGTGELIGLFEGDIITQINNTIVTSPQEIVQYMSSISAGDEINISYFRQGDNITKATKVKMWPELENCDNRYLEVPFDNGYLRAVLLLPQGVQNPSVIFFIQGIGCGSIYYLPEYHPYKRIQRQFVEEGFGVFLIEKPGAGDSKGTLGCSETGFEYEKQAFEEGYKFLKTIKDIDTNGIYLFGHSFGGVHCPILAEKYNPKGVIVYGTVLRAWIDYLIELSRYQGVWLGEDYADVNQSMHDLRKTYYQLFYNNKSPEELYKKEPYKTVLEQQLGYEGEGQTLIERHYSFHVEANQVNLALHWKNTHSRVLTIYGEADIESLYPYDHERIVELVNHYRPNTAEFWLYSDTDHSFLKVGTLMDGIKIRTEGNYEQAMKELYNEQLIKDVVTWIRK